jgi:GNAT superfamily N-acetyltransferase
MIRQATTTDLPALAAIERSAATLFLGTHMAWAADGPTLPRRLLTSAVRHGLLLLAEDTAPVGFVVAAQAYGTLYIQELSVAASHQRRGLGTALLHALIALARARGSTAVTLTTDRNLPWNRPFYARAGFVELPPESCPAWLAAHLRQQAQHGNNPALRCAMRLAL